MATSLPVVDLPANTWVDIYNATSIAVGTKIIVQNIGVSTVRLTESAAEPASNEGYNLATKGEFVTNSAANVGSWAISSSGGKLQVEEA